MGRFDFMKKNKVVVLLSTYNGEQYIEEQLRSIVKQNNFKDIDVIIRDDGSKDSTVDILKKYAKKYSNIKFLVGKNIGLVPSFFYLLRYSYNYNYEYYAFCDQDDYWMPDKIDVALNKLQYGGIGKVPLLYGSCSWLVDSALKMEGRMTTQKENRPISLYNAVIQNICPGHTQVLNKLLVKIILDHTKSLKNIYSQDLWIITVASAMGKVIFDNTPHVLYRMHVNNQLGYGQTTWNRLISHIKRLKKGETRLISKQMQTFLDFYSDYLTKNEKKELRSFLDMQSSMIKRVKYIKKTKLYRQTSKETKLFKLLYILGFYEYT